jgi:hypothetical protein
MTGKARKFEPLFQAAPDWQNNACVHPRLTSISTYADGYKEAARILVDSIVSGSRHKVDTLVYPIVFNYRQYLELRLKEIVLHGRQLSNDAALHDDTHILSRSLGQLKDMLSREPDLPPAPDLDFVEHIVSEFESLDPASFAFRYATDKGQAMRSIPYDVDHINVRHFADMVERAAEALDGISMYITVLPDWRGDEFQCGP